MAMGPVPILWPNRNGVSNHFGRLPSWKFDNHYLRMIVMETALVIAIVAAVVIWIGWSAYKVISGKSSGCSCTSSCNKNDCAELPESNDKS